MFTKSTLFSVAALGLSAVCANASTIDLSPLSPSIAPVQFVPELTITAVSSGVGVTDAFINVAPIDILSSTEITFGSVSFGSVNPVTGFAEDPTFANDFTIDFTTASTGVKFSVLDAAPDTATSAVDAVVLSIFGASGLLGTESFGTADALAGTAFTTTTTPSFEAFTFDIDLSSYGAITSLSFDDQAADPFATGGFVYYGLEVSPIPLPASMPLLIAGAGLFGVMRLRQRKKA